MATFHKISLNWRLYLRFSILFVLKREKLMSLKETIMKRFPWNIRFSMEEERADLTSLQRLDRQSFDWWGQESKEKIKEKKKHSMR